MIVDCPKCARRHVILERAQSTRARCDCGHEFLLQISASQSGVVKCGNCGANPPAGVHHCTYCDAHLAKVRCARCLANMIEGDQHCRACGHLLATPVHKLKPASNDALACPRCKSPLRSIMVGDALLDECSRCGGVWLEHDMFRDVLASPEDHGRLTATLNELIPVAQRPITAGSNDRGDRPESDGRFYVPCPVCDALLDRKQFARISGVVIDVCRAHGIWFDHDELSRIVRFVSAGGMEAAANKLHEQRVSVDAQIARTRNSSQAASDVKDDLMVVGGTAYDVIIGLLSALLR